MKIDADLHNFGQKVSQIERASGIYFQKPRPIYWEWFFFGATGPLKSIFATKIGAALFNLDVHFDNGDCGFSRQVVEDNGQKDQSAHAYNLGVLIAYCYLFGIRDLHKGNVIKRKTHLQVIDAEVVLSKILLPNETLILPFKITTADGCAANKSFNDIASIDNDSLRLILSGYFDLFSDVLEKHGQIVSVLTEHREKMIKVPIRHIMRDTIEYRRWLENRTVPAIPFCSDELIQLERGDVPYYFKLIGDPNLYAYKTPEGEFEAIKAPDEFLKGINRDATDPFELLAASRLINELLPNGSLFLLKKLVPKGFTGIIDGGSFRAEVSSKDLQVSFGGKIFKTTL